MKEIQKTNLNKQSLILKYILIGFCMIILIIVTFKIGNHYGYLRGIYSEKCEVDIAMYDDTYEKSYFMLVIANPDVCKFMKIYTEKNYTKDCYLVFDYFGGIPTYRCE